ncbi:MAG TPA: autotransporter outer membrane beta-barrel domain-containing protein, partial [Povalibacter sp.]|nr:autotransporter outer membrane beta-barrel domain-containing protein [Povalibacter sp.]
QYDGVVSGTGGLTIEGGGTVLLTQAESFTGPTSIVSGTLQAGTTDVLAASSAMTLAAGTTFDLSGFHQLVSDLDNAGTVVIGSAPAVTAVGAGFRKPALQKAGSGQIGTTLTVRGNYVGRDGNLLLDTTLGADNSPADQLVIDGGTASGATHVHINNTGGTGAVTVADGIRIVDAINGASTANGAFTLASRVVAGPYEYLLFHGGNAATGGNPNDGDWYLRNEGPPEPPPIPPVPVPPIPPGPEPTPIPEPVVVINRPEVATYLGNARAAMSMFTHTLHERSGHPQFALMVRGAGDKRVGSAWLRTAGRDVDVEAHDDFTFDMNGRLWVVQGGLELAQFELAGDAELYVGAMFGYGEASVTSRALGNPYRSHGEVDGDSGGLYLTWYANPPQRLGLYVDLWANYGEFDNEIEPEGLARVDYDSSTLTASLELGYAWWLNEKDRTAVEPQLQLLYTDYDQDDVTEINGTIVTDAAKKITTGRAGVRYFVDAMAADGLPVQPYVELNWWHDFQSERVSLNTISFRRGVPLDRYEVGAGVAAQFADHWSAWLNAEWQFGAHDYRGIEATVGIRVSW